MRLQYFGHSFWKVESEVCSVAIDPFDNIGYPMPSGLTADYVLISHEHHDHNNAALITGEPQVFRTAGLHSGTGMTAELIPVFHDDSNGSKRGINHIIKLEMDGLILVHCGDLGHLPATEILSRISQPDLLLIPVGEIYTLSLNAVWQMVEAVKPRLIFPMHYNSQILGFKLGELSNFSSRVTNLVKIDTNIVEITPDLLKEPKTIIMNWKN